MTARGDRSMRDEMRHEMKQAARDLLGSGYVSEYYESAAGDFVFIAESYAKDVLAARTASRPVAAPRPKSRRRARAG